MILLTDKYNLAFLGHEPSTNRAVYSLPMLAHIEGKKLRIEPEIAMRVIADMASTFMKDHGAQSPIFVDDTISRVEQEEQSRIILPEGPGFNRGR